MKKPEHAIATSTKTRFEDSDDNESVPSESENEENELEKELAEVTFEELQKARSDGSETVYRKRKLEQTTGRLNKNRPMEMSSKKPVGRFKEVIQVPKKVIRDPRFETLCGELDVDGFRKRYGFIYESTLPAERQELRKEMKKTDDPELKKRLKTHVSQINQGIKAAAPKRTEKEILAEHKKKERDAAKKGKQPYYLKQSEIRKQKLVEQYNELKKAGKLEAFIEKKRRKNASKDRKFVPGRRPVDE